MPLTIISYALLKVKEGFNMEKLKMGLTKTKNALFGFVNVIYKQLETIERYFAAVAFDL